MRSKAGTSATDKESFNRLIDEQNTLVALLTGSVTVGTGSPDGGEVSMYFRSGPCLNEIRRAKQNGIRIIFLLEIDPTHGGVSLDVHRRDCPADLLGLLESAPCISWYRVQAFQDVSVRRLAREILYLEAADNGLAEGGEGVYHPREVTRQPIRLIPPADGKAFHVYAPNLPGCAELVDEVARYAWSTNNASLAICIDPNRMTDCNHFFLYLNARTHDETLPHRAALYRELEVALNQGMHILLVHEQRPDKGGTTFAAIIEATPMRLRDELGSQAEFIGKRLCACAKTQTLALASAPDTDRGACPLADKELAIGICGGPHLPVSLHLLLAAISVVPGPA